MPWKYDRIISIGLLLIPLAHTRTTSLPRGKCCHFFPSPFPIFPSSIFYKIGRMENQTHQLKICYLVEPYISYLCSLTHCLSSESPLAILFHKLLPTIFSREHEKRVATKCDKDRGRRRKSDLLFMLLLLFAYV